MPNPIIDDDYEYVALPPEERARIVVERLGQLERERFTRKVEEALQAATGADPFPDLAPPPEPVIPEDAEPEVVEEIEAQYAAQVEANEAERLRREEEKRQNEEAADNRLNAAAAIFDEVKIRPPADGPETPTR